MEKLWKWFAIIPVPPMLYAGLVAARPVAVCAYDKCLGDKRGPLMITVLVCLVVMSIGLWLRGNAEKSKAVAASRKLVAMTNDAATVLDEFSIRVISGRILLGVDGIMESKDAEVIRAIRRLRGRPDA